MTSACPRIPRENQGARRRGTRTDPPGWCGVRGRVRLPEVQPARGPEVPVVPSSPQPLRRLVVAVLMCTALLAGTTACGGDDDTNASSEPSATSTAQKQKLAKTRFVANAGIAAGATYQWIVKPWKAGKFKKGADGRKVALVK